jgi:hypothetical protein
MAVSERRKQEILVVALGRELAAAQAQLSNAMSTLPARTADVLADADAQIALIRQARNYVADVQELLVQAQNPETPVPTV